MSNSLWQIAFGPYALTVDRRTLRFDLRDTKAGIDWAESLSLGWIELQNRETNSVSRHDFGDCKIVSVAEKAGAQGKRILFGLDAPGGVPIDVYVICTEREIQLTVEASRDTKTHRVMGFGLVPGLVSVPDDGASYLVLPSGEGSGILARDIADEKTQIPPPQLFRYPIWQADGVSMPFVGAVRAKDGAQSVADAPAGSIGMITDSVYGLFRLKRNMNGSAVVDLEYERDPERRRLDVRLVVMPSENHVGVARAYRDKIIGEKNHVTLRRKIRERPVIQKLIGAAWYADVHVDGVTPFKPDAAEVWGTEHAPCVQAVAMHPPDNPAPLVTQISDEVIALHLDEQILNDAENRWQALEHGLERITEAQKDERVAIGLQRGGDWSVIAVDFFQMLLGWTLLSFVLPLFSVVYHDAVVVTRATGGFQRYLSPSSHSDGFLSTLLQAASGFYSGLSLPEPPTGSEVKAAQKRNRRVRMHAVLSPLHRLTFTAFLTAHRFLTPNALVEEAEYSDKTHIIINRSATEPYETPNLHLPPGGFFVRHTQMEAYDALRVGDQVFDTRAFRIRRALDGKPLEQSTDVETREFLVEPV